MTTRRKRKRRPESAGEAVLALLGELGLTDQAKRLVIAQCWPRVVGPEIAARTEPDGFSRGVLRVRASTAAWQNELTYLKAEIRVRLNALLGKPMVSDIRVVGGTVRPRDPEPVPPWLAEPPTPTEKDAAQAMSTTIGDPDVRDSFEHLLCMHWRAARHR